MEHCGALACCLKISREEAALCIRRLFVEIAATRELSDRRVYLLDGGEGGRDRGLVINVVIIAPGYTVVVKDGHVIRQRNSRSFGRYEIVSSGIVHCANISLRIATANVSIRMT